MPKPVNVAVTGMGVSVGMLHLYRNSPDTKLIMLHDTNNDRLQQVAKDNPSIILTEKWDDVLSSDADMVDISTPNQVHASQAVDALRAGKHVLCQKPMAPSVADCRQMCDTAQKTGKTLGMLMVMQGIPLFRSLKKVIYRGLLGKIASVHIRNAHRGPFLRKDKKHWRSKSENIGGGSYMQLGIHYLNLVQWILDEEVERVCGFSDNLYCRHSLEGEDVVAAAGEFSGGTKITMESGYSSVGNVMAIYGTAGHCIMSGNGVMMLEANASYVDENIVYPGSNKTVGEVVALSCKNAFDRKQLPINYPHTQQLAFARAIRAGEPAPVPGELGLRDVAIVQAIYQAAKLGRTVEVNEFIN